MKVFRIVRWIMNLMHFHMQWIYLTFWYHPPIVFPSFYLNFLLKKPCWQFIGFEELSNAIRTLVPKQYSKLRHLLLSTDFLDVDSANNPILRTNWLTIKFQIPFWQCLLTSYVGNKCIIYRRHDLMWQFIIMLW